ncbi:MAG: DUF1326 domain-containing protein, partial [Acidobacteriia bacterium]|nr:DUF1326 domain-containing protein [Terriglobia bacterium]
MKLIQLLIVIAIVGPAAFWSSDKQANSIWHIKGSLSEACSCSVPCTCNFGELPSPHPYCYSMYSYKIDKGHHGDVPLDGLKFGSMDARYGRMLYIDERANEAQRAALAQIAEPLLGLKDPVRFYPGQSMAHIGTRYVEIAQESDEKGNHLKLGSDREFRAEYIMGRDGKTPVVVKNNTTWAIDDAIKGKTSL